MSQPITTTGLARVYARFQAFQRTIDSLWAKLAPEGEEKNSQTLAFMSSDAGEGATMMSTCAAIGLARHLRARVLLVEANYSSPRLAHYLDVESYPGLIEVLTAEADFEEAVRATDVAGLEVLPVGDGTQVTPGLFSSERATKLFDALAKDYDYVLFDVAPVLDQPDSHSLLRRVDAACLVVQAGKTRKDRAEKALSELAQAGVSVLGTILNRYQSEVPSWLGGNRAA